MKILYTVAILFLLLLSLRSTGQGANWAWAETAGGYSQSAGGIDYDGRGNLYVIGGYASPSITFGSTTLNNAGGGGSGDIYIAKYDTLGNVLWAKSFGGAGNDFGIGINADAEGNFYVTGAFASQSIAFGSTVLTKADTGNMTAIFIAKFDAAGDVIWAKSYGGTGNDWGEGVSNNINSGVYITGYFSSATIHFGTYTLVNHGTGGNIFTARLDTSGNVIWAESAAGTGYADAGYSICPDAFGNVYITGEFNSPSIVFGTDTLTLHVLVNGAANFFVAKYDSAGNVLWAQSVGGSEDESGGSVSTDAAGNAYVTGAFSSSHVVFGSDTLNNAGTNISNDMFIVKYDAAGNVVWAQSVGGTGSEGGASIKIYTGGIFYLTGGFTSSSLEFGNVTLTNPNTGVEKENIFIAKYDTSGNVLWAACGGKCGASGQGICADADGNAYVTGTFLDTNAVFGPDTLNSSIPGSGGFMVARYGAAVATGITGPANMATGITVYPNPSTGNIYFTGVKSGQYLTIYDITGDVIVTSEIDADTYSITLGEKAKGIYFYSIRDSNYTAYCNGKFIIQ